MRRMILASPSRVDVFSAHLRFPGNGTRGSVNNTRATLFGSGNMMAYNGLRGFLTLCVVWTCGLVAVAKNTSLRENYFFDSEKWRLVPTENGTITSLSDLTTGVYSIQLSGERPGCKLDSEGPGTAIFSRRQALSETSAAAFQTVLTLERHVHTMQHTLDSTTGPAPPTYPGARRLVP